jgi:hypothetical protein
LKSHHPNTVSIKQLAELGVDLVKIGREGDGLRSGRRARKERGDDAGVVEDTDDSSTDDECGCKADTKDGEAGKMRARKAGNMDRSLLLFTHQLPGVFISV